MDNIFKKVINTGVGVFSKTTEQVKKVAEDISQQQSEIEEVGKTKLDEYQETFASQRDAIGEQLRKVMDTVLGQFDLPNRTDAERLNAKIAELEERIKALPEKGETKKPAARKKAAPKKKVVRKKKAIAPAEGDAAGEGKDDEVIKK